MIPKHREKDGVGKDPILNIKDFTDNLTLTRAFNWHAYFNQYIQPKKFIIDYMKKRNYDSKLISKIERIRESRISNNLAVLARLATYGKVSNENNAYLNNTIQSLCKEKDEIDPIESIKRKENKLLIFIEDCIDDFIQSKYMNIDISFELNGISYLKSDLEYSIKFLLDLIDEINDIEAYDHLNKKQRKNYNIFLLKLQNVLSSSSEEKLSIRKPRKPRKKNYNLLSKKVKYCLEWENIKSFDVIKLFNIKELYVYNIKYNQLKYYTTKDSKLEIKGSTILNFDVNDHWIISLKKKSNYKEFLKTFSKIGSRELKKELKNIKRIKITNTTGRLNKDTVLLKYVQ